MTKIPVPDMMCENCVRRITDAFSAGGLGFRVSLADRSVWVEDPGVPAALEALEDLGFTPEAPAGAQ